MGKRVPEAERRRIAERVRDGESIAQVARSEGMHRETVTKYCEQFAVPIPPTPQAKKAEKNTAKVSGRFRQAFEKLGVPPEDTLERNEWASQAVAVCMQMAATEEELDAAAKTRIDLVNKLANTLKSLTPYARLLQAENIVKGMQDKLDEDSPGPEMEDAEKLESPGHRAPPIRR